MDDLVSPCTDVCRLDRQRRWCIGCGRTASEIARWPSADDDVKRAILKKLPARLAQLGKRAC